MSDHIPFHVQVEILKRLPVKSLIQFRSVSKAWKSLIDSSEFIATHSLHRHTHQQHLLVSYDDSNDERQYVSYIDDNTFPQQRSISTFPLYITQLSCYDIIGSSHGLLCLYKGMAVLWNPTIRKSIVVVVPGEGEASVGFGVCSVTSGPKIVSITRSFTCTPEGIYKCEVLDFALSSGKWTSLSTNLPPTRIWDLSCSRVTDGFIYWRAGTLTHNMIMSFDITNESFQVIYLPDTLARHDPYLLRSKIRESLAMLEYRGNKCIVWMMEHGAQRSFTKLFIIKTLGSIVGFRKNGIPIMRVMDGEESDSDDSSSSDGYYNEHVKLVVYEPNSEHNNVIGFAGSPLFLHVNSYMETLLLLGRSDCISN